MKGFLFGWMVLLSIIGIGLVLGTTVLWITQNVWEHAGAVVFFLILGSVIASLIGRNE